LGPDVFRNSGFGAHIRQQSTAAHIDYIPPFLVRLLEWF